MSGEILITGASGLLGRAVVRELRGKPIIVTGRKSRASEPVRELRPGQESRILDLKTMEGVREAPKGIQTIFHLASATRGFDRRVDVVGTQALLEAAKAEGVRHFVFISIVGIDKVPLKYYKIKLETEKAVQESGVPFTILRATQFHEFLDFIASKLLRFPIAFLPKGLRFQPVETAATARCLVQIGSEKPHNDILEFGGPEIFDLGTLAAKWLHATGKKCAVVDVPRWMIGKGLRAIGDGGLTTKVKDKESMTWEAFLAGKRG